MVLRRRFLIIGVIVVVCVIGLIFAGYWFQWSWTGFGPETSEPRQHAKTLWDWFQLLVVPIMLVIGGFWLNQIQKSRDERIAEQQAKSEQEVAEKRAQTEREIAEDNQQEAALQDYIDKISELLLHEKLRESAKEDEVRKIARVRTLTVLLRLNASRKTSVFQFLHESRLILKESIISLEGADLGGINLLLADLREVSLWRVNLEGANLYEATVTQEQLEEAQSLKGATMPDVTIHL
jgi:uncharacterized membrane protein